MLMAYIDDYFIGAAGRLVAWLEGRGQVRPAILRDALAIEALCLAAMAAIYILSEIAWLAAFPAIIIMGETLSMLYLGRMYAGDAKRPWNAQLADKYLELALRRRAAQYGWRCAVSTALFLFVALAIVFVIFQGSDIGAIDVITLFYAVSKVVRLYLECAAPRPTEPAVKTAPAAAA